MNHEELYQDWIRQHRDVRIDDSFADKLMRRIRHIESDRCASRITWSRITDWIGYSRWARAAAVAVAALLGLGRIVLTLRLLLFT
jgi:hypothetical protein